MAINKAYNSNEDSARGGVQLCIVTVNYNDCEGLRATLDSIRRQSCQDFEYIVVDGGSTDESVAVIQSNADLIDQWVSEPDAGIYNAMNKGVGMYGGEGYVIFMNAGDIFYDDRIVERFLSARPTSDIVCGGWVGARGKALGLVTHAPVYANLYWLLFATLPHNSCFVKSALLRRRPYREDYTIVSDWIFFWEALLQDQASYQRLDYYVCQGDTSGISNAQHGRLLAERERYLSSILPEYVYKPIVQDLNRYQCRLYNCPRYRTLSRLFVLAHEAVHGTFATLLKVLRRIDRSMVRLRTS